MEIIEQQKYVSVPSNKTQITEHFKSEFQITNDTYLMDLTNTDIPQNTQRCLRKGTNTNQTITVPSHKNLYKCTLWNAKNFLSSH